MSLKFLSITPDSEIFSKLLLKLFQFTRCNKIMKNFKKFVKKFLSIENDSLFFRMTHEFWCITFDDVKDQYVIQNGVCVSNKQNCDEKVNWI